MLGSLLRPVRHGDLNLSAQFCCYFANNPPRDRRQEVQKGLKVVTFSGSIDFMEETDSRIKADIPVEGLLSKGAVG